MDNKEKFIAKTKGGKTRRLAKTGTKLRIGATKKAMGPVGGLPVDEKGLKEGGMVVKDKVVAIDKSPNSGLITTKGFGAGRRT